MSSHVLELLRYIRNPLHRVRETFAMGPCIGATSAFRPRVGVGFWVDMNVKLKLQLTPRGRAVDRERWAMGFKHRTGLPPPPDLDYVAPVEDGDGWSEWTLADLLETFGPIWHIHSGRLFEPVFQIVLNAGHQHPPSQ